MSVRSTGAWQRPAFLASVTSVAEARIAVANGADIIDCKNPHEGALGALPLDVVSAIRAAVPSRIPVSATIGDPDPDPDLTVGRVRAMAERGVSFVKVGFDGGVAGDGLIAKLGASELGSARLVGLLFADRQPKFGLVRAMHDAGFAGAMLDTADKSAGALVDVLAAPVLQAFVAETRLRGMYSGLAGSLRLTHISNLTALRPDVLGFRGALCAGLARAGSLEEAAVRAVAAELRTTQLKAAARQGRVA